MKKTWKLLFDVIEWLCRSALPIKGGENLTIVEMIIVAVVADLISHYIRKWLDKDDKKGDEPKED